MKVMKILAIVCSIVFVVSMGLGAVFAALGFKDGFASVAEALENGEYGDELFNNGTLTADAEDMANLIINAGAAEITLIRQQRSDVQLDYSYRYFGSIIGTPITLDDNEDTVEIKTETNSFHFLSSWRQLTCTVYIPKEYDGNLSIDIGAGTVTVQGQQQFDVVNITVGAGTLSADDLTANTVDADISVGKFTADRLKTSDLTLNVGVGDAELKGLTGKTDLTVDMGNATLSYDFLGGSVTANVSLGHAAIYLPDDVNATLELTASMGSVSQSFGSNFSGESCANQISGKLNNGGTSITGTVDMGSLDILEAADISADNV